VRIAAARPEPIPVYAEMSSINPVFLLPLHWPRGGVVGRGFAASLTMGAGQFCTNPGWFSRSKVGTGRFPWRCRRGAWVHAGGHHAHSGITLPIKRGDELQASPCLTEVARGAKAREGSFEGQAALLLPTQKGFNPILRCRKKFSALLQWSFAVPM
jgi:NADP-dependent aldehyde dehydrogenase